MHLLSMCSVPYEAIVIKKSPQLGEHVGKFLSPIEGCKDKTGSFYH